MFDLLENLMGGFACFAIVLVYCGAMAHDMRIAPVDLHVEFAK